MAKSNNHGVSPYSGGTNFEEHSTSDPRRTIYKCLDTNKFFVKNNMNGVFYPLSDPLDPDSSPAKSTVD